MCCLDVLLSDTPGAISRLIRLERFVEFIIDSSCRYQPSERPRLAILEINAMIEFYGQGCILTKSIAAVNLFHTLNMDGSSELAMARVR